MCVFKRMAWQYFFFFVFGFTFPPAALNETSFSVSLSTNKEERQTQRHPTPRPHYPLISNKKKIKKTKKKWENELRNESKEETIHSFTQSRLLKLKVSQSGRHTCMYVQLARVSLSFWNNNMTDKYASFICQPVSQSVSQMVDFLFISNSKTTSSSYKPIVAIIMRLCFFFFLNKIAYMMFGLVAYDDEQIMLFVDMFSILVVLFFCFFSSNRNVNSFNQRLFFFCSNGKFLFYARMAKIKTIEVSVAITFCFHFISLQIMDRNCMGSGCGEKAKPISTLGEKVILSIQSQSETSPFPTLLCQLLFLQSCFLAVAVFSVSDRFSSNFA